MPDEQVSHREYSFVPQRAIVDRETRQPVDIGRGECTCGWTTTGRDDECLQQYSEHIAAASPAN